MVAKKARWKNVSRKYEEKCLYISSTGTLNWSVVVVSTDSVLKVN